MRTILAHSGVLWDSIRVVLAFLHSLKKILILEIGAELSKYWQYIGRLDPYFHLKSEMAENLVQNSKSFHGSPENALKARKEDFSSVSSSFLRALINF